MKSKLFLDGSGCRVDAEWMQSGFLYGKWEQGVGGWISSKGRDIFEVSVSAERGSNQKWQRGICFGEIHVSMTEVDREITVNTH